jgi:hypothetical protein
MPISHIIYHIPGRKVGCTKDLDGRKRMYFEMEGSIPTIEILEVLHGKTNQEVGDREWFWADKLGYKRENHYTVIMNAVQVRSIKGNSYSFDEKSRIGKLAGLKVLRLGLGVHGLTTEQRKINGRKGAEQTVKLKLGIHALTTEEKSRIGSKVGGCVQLDTCPHCGLVASIPNLHRWHHNNCPHKKKSRFVRGNNAKL